MEPQIITDAFNSHFMPDTIAAISTSPGVGGIAVVRISGPEAITIVDSAWKGKKLSDVTSHTVHFGKYITKDGIILDECVATVFRSPSSFTGENIVELGVHGSSYIQREILTDLIKRGARIANPGEFTQRAFLNGKLDLAQAEGIADLIASSSKASHDLAINQTRGSFSKEFNSLRDKLIEFASLMELELDFSEEEVEFANRQELIDLCKKIISKVDSLSSSYSRGAVLKNGVPVVIAGVPNAGKSSLLNLLLGDDKAIVTEIPGTTRDTIEDTIEINGVLYRFIDTAGLRDTEDKVESMGIDRAIEALGKAYLVIWLIDVTQDLNSQLIPFDNFRLKNPETPIIILLSKADTIDQAQLDNTLIKFKTEIASLDALNDIIPFSSKTGLGFTQLIEKLSEITTAGYNTENDILITNARHYEALTHSSSALHRVLNGLQINLSGDLISQDIREAITHLSLITGSITTDNLLHSIFSHFCIGK